MRRVLVPAGIGFLSGLFFLPMPTTANAGQYCRAVQQTFSGSYTGKTPDGMASMTLKQESDGTVSGTVKIGSDTMGLKGRAETDRITGTIQVNGAETPLRFEIKRSGSTVRFGMITGGDAPEADEIIIFTPEGRAKESAPAPKSPIPARPSAVAVAPAVTAGWKTYKHPVGLALRYPGNWTMKEGEGMLLLTPPDVATAASGPQEVYLIRANPVNGITRVNDPRILQMCDQELAKLGTLQREGDGEAIKAGGVEGHLLTWSGTNPQTGKPITVRLYGSIQKDYLLYVIGIGVKDKVTARDKTLRGIFSSFGVGESQIDPQLVGEWQSSTADNGRILRLGNTVNGTSASDSWRRYRLMGDGTLVETSYSRTIVNTPGASLDTGDSVTTKKGRWNAGGGKLTLFMEDGTTRNLGYRFTDGYLVIVNPNGKADAYARR